MPSILCLLQLVMEMPNHNMLTNEHVRYIGSVNIKILYNIGINFHVGHHLQPNMSHGISKTWGPLFFLLRKRRRDTTRAESESSNSGDISDDLGLGEWEHKQEQLDPGEMCWG